MQNYQREMESELCMLSKIQKRPSLLLHACCAPCSSYTLEALAEYFDITVYYYNPNISPQSEYDFRAEELVRYVSEAPCGKNVRVEIPPYDSAPFFETVAGHEDEDEGGERCKKCYRLRLRKTAQIAAERGFEYFCTTLSISPYKDAAALNSIGGELAEEYGVRYLFSDFKKKGGYARSILLSHEYNLYRQNYCGCVYSKIAAEKRGK